MGFGHVRDCRSPQRHLFADMGFEHVIDCRSLFVCAADKGFANPIVFLIS